MEIFGAGEEDGAHYSTYHFGSEDERGGPQLTASKERRTSSLQLQGTEFCQDFPGSPMVRSLHFDCRKPGFDPWSGN